VRPAEVAAAAPAIVDSIPTSLVRLLDHTSLGTNHWNNDRAKYQQKQQERHVSSD
jgi:hypothetical protein